MRGIRTKRPGLDANVQDRQTTARERRDYIAALSVVAPAALSIGMAVRAAALSIGMAPGAAMVVSIGGVTTGAVSAAGATVVVSSVVAVSLSPPPQATRARMPNS